MQLNNTELSALADHLVNVIECSPEFEDDEFCITFSGVRLYCERYITHYRIEVGHEDEVVEIPRH